MRFIGNIEAKTDAKGRVFLPSAFRKVLQASGEERVVMRRDVFQPCIVLYPESVWSEQTDSLRARLSRWNAAHQQIFRQYVAEAELLAIDASGRILLPRRYIEAAGLGRDLRFIGMGDTIEVWSAERARQPFMDTAAFGQALESLMGGTHTADTDSTPSQDPDPHDAA